MWLVLPTWLLHPEKRRVVQRNLWWNVHGHVRLGVEKIRVGQQILLTSTRQEEKKRNWHFKRPPWLVCLAWRWLIIHHHRKGTWFGNALQWTRSICAFTESVQVIKAEGDLHKEKPTKQFHSARICSFKANAAGNPNHGGKPLQLMCSQGRIWGHYPKSIYTKIPLF